MQIPFGYGFCNIKLRYVGVVQPPGSNGQYFFVDQNSFREIIEIKDEFVNLNNMFIKKVKGFHYNFDLMLFDYNYPDSQNNIMNFLYCYNLTDTEGKYFELHPTRSQGMGYSTDMAINVFADEIKLINFTSKRTVGQKLHIKCHTKDMIDILEFPYRDTISGEWAFWDGGMAKGGSSSNSGLGDKKYGYIPDIIGRTGIVQTGYEKIGII